MQKLFDEIFNRFPEIRDRLADEDPSLPFLVIRHLVDWLGELHPSQLTPDLNRRLVDFADWCEQERGPTAETDPYTIWVVGFFENLFDSASTRRLIPKLKPKEELVANAEYLRCWVGAENYELALREYETT